MAWDDARANVADNIFSELKGDFQADMVVLTYMAYHPAVGDSPNQKPCKQGTWGVRMVIDTVLSLLMRACKLKKVGYRTWSGVKARLADTMALYNILMMWDGIPADGNGVLHISLGQFVL